MSEINEAPKTSAREKFLFHLKANLFTGILVTAPISITIYLTWVFLVFVDSKVTPLLPHAYNPNSYLPFSLPGLGLIITVIFFIAVGWFARNVFGRMIIRTSEYFVQRVPVIRTLYNAIKQIFETVMTSQSQAFREVVMFEYPRKGTWALGFVTGYTKGEVQRLTEDEVVNVFVPTTPNPTSGFLLFIPRQDLVVMKMSVEDGIKMIVSGGIITPTDKGDDHLEQPKISG
jgi:uncharacterized membrane protein